MPCLPQQRDDAGPGKASLLAKPGLVFVADRKSQRVGGAGRFRGGRPLALRKPQQRVDSGARDRVPVRPWWSTMAFPEVPNRLAQIMAHLRFAHIRDRDIPPRKVVKEPSRVNAVVPNHHRAVLLAGQYDPEFGDQFVIGIRHRWLLGWSNWPPRFAGKIMRSKACRSLAELRGIHALKARSFTLSSPHDYSRP